MKPYWEAAGGGSSAWGPATCMGDLNEVLNFWLQPGPAIAIAAIWWVNWQVEDLSLLFVSLIWMAGLLNKWSYLTLKQNSVSLKQYIEYNT